MEHRAMSSKAVFVVFLCLFVRLASSQTVWNDVFSQNITVDPNIDQNYNVDVQWTGTTGIFPKIDPLTVDPVLLDIAGEWPFDSQSSTSPPTTPDISAVPVAATVYDGTTWLPTGGKFGGAYSFDKTASPPSYLEVSPSPLTNHEALVLGFSMSLWVNLPAVYARFSSAVLFQRIYDAFAMNVYGNVFQCIVRNSAGQFFTATGSSNYTANQWTHLACTWDPTTNLLSMYVKGQPDVQVQANLSIGLYFGDGSNLGIGNQPSTCMMARSQQLRTNSSSTTASASVSAIIDEVIFYKKTLQASDVLSLSQRTTSVVPFPGPSFRSTLIPWTGSTANYWDVTPSWVISSPGASTDVYVEISTNRGKTWCNVTSGVALGMDDLCYLPAANIMYRVTFLKKVTIQSVSFTYLDTEPERSWPSEFILGTNRNPPSYYSTNWVFVDVQKTASWSVTPGPNYDANYFPLSIDPTNPPTWLTAAPLGPYGNYTVFGNGTGTLGFAEPKSNWKNPKSAVHLPNSVGTPILQPSGVGMFNTSATNPISEINIVMPGFESNYTTNPFHPYYLERFQGVNTVRFMDMMSTNGNQIAKWSDRTLTSYFSQRVVVTKTATIASIVDASSTYSNFSGYWKALITITGAHPFSTGQVITLTGTTASLSYSYGGASQGTITFNGTASIIEVVSTTSFYWRYSDHGNNWIPNNKTANTIDSFTGSSTGSASVAIYSGLAIEYLIQLAVTQNANAWFNIPTLADDDYITQFGTLIFNQLPPTTKAYVEYGNELWNYGFSQYHYVQLMGNSYSGGAAAFVAARVARIYTILDGIFGDSASSRLIKLMPAFAGGSNWGNALLTWMNDTTINPTGIQIQAMAIAPYFGEEVGSNLCGNDALINSTTEDEILDMIRDDIYGVVPLIASNYAVAQQHGVALVAYEAGQSLANALACSDPNGNWYNSHTITLLAGANRHPRMKDIYRQFFWLWAANGGQLMNHFSDYGTYSQWGSWALLETQTQATNISYKYQAFIETVAAQNNPQASAATTLLPLFWLLLICAALFFLL